MTSYQLSEEKYVDMVMSLKNSQRNNLHCIIGCLILLIVLVLSFIIGQYLFALILLGSLVFYIFFSVKVLKYGIKNKYKDNALLSKNILISFSNENIMVEIERNVLTLLASDIRFVALNKKVAYLQHNIGIQLYIPLDKIDLSDKEIFINNYLSKFEYHKK